MNNEKVKDIIAAFLCSIVVLVITLAYIFVFGIPKTKARNLYNQGVRSLEEGDPISARNHFQESLAKYETDSAHDMLEVTEEILRFPSPTPTIHSR